MPDVLVESVVNGVQRKMTRANYDMNQIKWRLIGTYSDGKLVPAQGIKVVEEKKREVVVRAENKIEIVTFKAPEQLIELTPVDDSTAQKIKEASPFVASVEETGGLGGGLIDAMRRQYEESTGKKADGRWNMKRLREEVSKLNQPA